MFTNKNKTAGRDESLPVVPPFPLSLLPFCSSGTFKRYSHVHVNLITAVLLLLILNLSPSVAMAQSSEEEALREVVQGETEAWMNRDAENWQSFWMQEPTTTITHVFGTHYRAYRGWEEIGPEAMKLFERSPDPEKVEISYDNFLIHTEGNIARMEYDQITTGPDVFPMDKRISREQRILQKKDGQWKISSLTSVGVNTFGESDEAIEYSLNDNGYHLLQAGRVKEAIELFKLNVALYPKAWNTYDSLGEAYAIAGNKKKAIKNYKKSIALNPNNEHGKKELAKLEQKALAAVK